MPNEPTVSTHRARRPAAPEAAVPSYLREDPGDHRRLRIAVVAALACHLPLLLLPRLGGEITAAPVIEEPRALAMPTPRFRPPEPPPAVPEPEPTRVERVVRVPIPAPTPEEPEPIRHLELAPLELPRDHLVIVPPAPAPAPPPAPPAVPEIFRVGGEIARPRAISTPHPVYPEVARRARVEGTVVLEVRLDERGRVEDVVVLRGQPLGLTAAAADAVSRWRYEPARHRGRAVAVMMVVTVHFELS